MDIPKKVSLVAVTKGRKTKEIEKLPQDIKIIAENRIQEAEEKFPTLKRNFEKHFIGHLQSNKAKRAIKLFDVIQTVDSIKLAKRLNRLTSKPLPIMIQVNISEDPNKFGFKPQKTTTAIKEILKLKNLKLIGLMTIGKKEETTHFKNLKNLYDELNRTILKKNPMEFLSMGTSDNYKDAIKQGSNMVRLGRILF